MASHATKSRPARKRQMQSNRPDGRAPRPHRRLIWPASLLAVLGIAAFLLLRQSPSQTVTAASANAPPGPAPDGMVWVPGGSFRMGTAAVPDAQPIHSVELDGFWMDRTEVTNAEFARFVKATEYKTVAERVPDAKDFPGAAADKLLAGSIVFTPPAGPVPLDNIANWWVYVPGACWNRPSGPGSDSKSRPDDPVVHVCWEDATAYAKWAGKQLPTEAQWEYAARGGIEQAEFVWGAQMKPGGKHMANTWQGSFPSENDAADGHAGLAPVGSLPANGFGLHDMSGNVWEWCADWYRPDAYADGPLKNPAGPTSSFDPNEPGVAKRVQRGGSFLCNDNYCRAYRPGYRGKGEVSSAASHIGFRCVRPR